MILTAATRHQRKISLCFLVLFYLEIGGPNIKSAFASNAPLLISNHRKFPIPDDGSETYKWANFENNRRAGNLSKVSIDEIVASPLTTGPGQPEMSSFQSVNASDMVDLFSGDFSYNIPLMDVGGYPVNIHYSGGVSMDQEASWVGLGWNINPGTISRSVRGMPDDFNGADSIEKTQSVKVNRTAGVTIGADFELGGLPLDKFGKLKNPADSSKVNSNPELTLGASLGVFHNTYNGWGTEFGVNASISAGVKGFGDLTGAMGLNSNTQSGVTASPSLSYSLRKNDGKEQGNISFGMSTGFNTRSGISALQLNTNVRLEKKFGEKENKRLSGTISHPIGVISFAKPSYTPSIGMPYTSTSFTFRGKIGTTAWAAHPSAFVEGYVSKQEIKEEDKVQRKPAVGYLYYSRANNNKNTLLDFNRDKDVSYIPNQTPNIAIPQFTYDVYSISGEGTGGMFRPYRGDLGFVRDVYMKTRSGSDKLSIDLGFGYIFHGGVDFAYTTSFSENNPWTSENDLAQHLKFRVADTTFEAVYFRNPGEKTSNSHAYYNSIGDDQLIRVRLTGKRENVRAGSSFMKFRSNKYTGEVNINAPIVKTKRDKRTQIISYLNAQEASTFGLDKDIVSYKENSIPGISCSDTVTIIKRVDTLVRKDHHLSHITVLNGDGRRYVYGIPAYNFEQRDVSFSVNKETNSANLNKGLVQYLAGSDNSTANDKGKEGYFSREITPAHAHSFLLTSIVSPDYVDLKNDGVTEDDMGDAVRFNYTRVFGEEGNRFKWRTPSDAGKANYNEGLKTDSRDDKASYMYGEKEVWYLNSVESKTMIAVFTIANDREDVYSVTDENGGLDLTRKMRRLKKIDLYVKADLVKKGINARPVKTVHFEYDYSLCKGVAGDQNKGKLTLKSVWFSYNGNEKGKLNPYVFSYHSFNPNYNPKHYDRWGNFKDPATNPKSGLTNADFPYAEQDSTNASKYASAWMLNEIQLPSGGKIRVTYEGDDYAYVQNKRATQFFKIMGVANTPLGQITNKLYQFPTGDNQYVVVKSAIPLESKNDVFEKFLKGNDWFYFKLAVSLPSDTWGGGTEFIPVYGEVEDWGMIDAGKFWLKLKEVDNNSPLTRSALEFLRLNLPSKAYPNSEPGDNMNVWDIVKLMGNSMANLATAIISYETKARTAGFCQVIDTSQSFIRLNNPGFKKRGGGYRVKRVEVFDNWKKMTNQKESVYGQEYNYTTTARVDGKEIVVSSGVASYEPMIGAEENPFRTPVPYSERIAPGAPVNHLYTELPMGESYFPSASVGYSKVRVRTINAKAKSANGWQETEFFTTKDFPTLVENTIIDEDAKELYKPKLGNFLCINAKNFVTLSQGFKIEGNDMNGKVKAQASYAETDSLKPISYVRNFYKVDNDTAYTKHLNNNVWTVDSVNGRVNKNGVIGKDIELMIDLREQYSRTVSGDYGLNIDYAQAGPFPWILPSSIPMPQMEQVRYRSFATVKIVQRYGILDSVVAMDKGSVVSTKNLLYDGETGEVVLSRTNNEFRDPIYNFSYPAHWAYSGMGMAYQNMDAVFQNLKLIKGVLYYGGQSTTPYPVDRFFESGDELLLMATLRSTQAGANCLQFTIDSINQPKPKTVPMKAWVMDASKGKEGDSGLYFIDGEGNPLTLEVNYMRIVRSGHRNLLDASVGSIVLMSDPVKDLGESGVRLVFDTSSRVVNTSAVTYKDTWKTERFIYPRDTIYKVYHNYSKTLSPVEVVNKQFNTRHQTTSTKMEAKNVIAAYDYETSSSCKKAIYTKSLLNFDLSGIPSDAIVISATMSFKGRKPNDIGPKQQLCGNQSFNWAGVNDYHEGVDSSFLRRITASWNASTPYDNVQSTITNQVKFAWNIYNNVSCTGLIQDLIDNENHGLAFEIGNNNHNVHKINFVSFCATNESNINCQGSNDNHDAMSCDCSAPVLVINYKSLDDSIANRCRILGEDSVINPYRLGLLGNWRVDRAYTFYGDRKESDAAVSNTNSRKEGELAAFSSFWQFDDSVLLPMPDTTKWVWNSASSLYSKRGFEIENYDPLGRYNAGLYGYNGTLPVAVAQNARYREIMYDGFEDYGYKSAVCGLCETPKEIDFTKNNSNVWLTDTVSHSGMYSLKIKAGSFASVTAPVVMNDTVLSISAGIDTSIAYGNVYHATGNGLAYRPRGYSTSNNPCPSLPGNHTAYIGLQASNIDFNWGSAPVDPNVCKDWSAAIWTGQIQVPYTDNYTFYGDADGGFQVKVNGVNVVEVLPSSGETIGKTIYLQAGQFYEINASYNHYTGDNAHVRLRWSRSMQPGVIETVPLEYLYNIRVGVDTLTYTPNVPINCVSANTVVPHNFIRPNFSPTYGSKVVVSAWVRMDGNDCNTAPALDSVIRLRRHLVGSEQSDVYLQRTGVRIEGWQRYETVITLDNTEELSIEAIAPSGRNIFVDDIRVQPYNSAMKTYAYNPINLRLMAELDENNYTTFYEYDDDGTLIRVKKETERGIMTIKESRSALTKK